MTFSDSQVPKKIGLLELLGQSIGVQFVIPVYQRNYTWTTGREVKQYLTDLKNVLEGDCTKHFMGIMIYLDTPLDYRSREFSIIDGQQRLTTTFLTLYAIKDLMIAQGQKGEAEQFEKQYFFANPFDAKGKFKLKPQVSDDCVYQQIVSGEFENITQKDSNVYKNYVYIKEFLSSLTDTYSVNDILMALNKLYIVCVPVSLDDYPQKIFESINATGAKLTASDLIRNFILMPIESDRQEEYYEKYWKKLEELLSSDSKKLESFFRIFLAIKNRDLPNKTAVYSKFIDWFEQRYAKDTVENIFREIVRYARYYHIIYKLDIVDVDSELRGAISEFRKIYSDMPASLFMELLSLSETLDENNKPLVTKSQVREIIGLTSTYLIRRALAGLDTSDITRLFPSLLKDILNECPRNYENIVDIFKKNLVNKNKGNSMEMPDDVKLYNSIVNANMYNIRTTLRLFFDKLELDGNPAPVDLSKLSIEHLMPQTPTPEWYKALGISEDEYNRNLHRLGNLTLAAKADNSKMRNNVWTYKNAVLASTSHLKMNEQLLKLEKWTIDDVDKRTKVLIKDIQRLYPYFEVDDAYIKKIPIYLEAGGIVATGEFYEDDGSVAIDEGSMLNNKFDNVSNYPDIEDIRQDLLDEGIIGEVNGTLVFLKKYIAYPASGKDTATALSFTASLILHGSRNGWQYWMFESGESLNTNANLRKKFSKKGE